jgi:hypothetical protein
MTNEKLTLRQLLIGLLMGIIACAMITLCTGCKSVETVVVTEHHTDTLKITKHQRDSVWLHDSIQVTEKGDTVKIEKWHTKYIEKLVRDTAYIAKRDSVPVPYPVKEYIEKPLNGWQKTLMFLGVLCILMILIWIWRTK